jgi:hypothetical protein
MRPRAVTARRRPAELLAGDHALPDPHRYVSPEVAVDRAHLPAEARDDYMVVDDRHRPRGVLVREAVRDVDHDAVEGREDRHADPLLAERADDRVLARVAVVGLRAAAPVEGARARVEVDEVREVEVLPRDSRLRVEGEGRGPPAGSGAAPGRARWQLRGRLRAPGRRLDRTRRAGALGRLRVDPEAVVSSAPETLRGRGLQAFPLRRDAQPHPPLVRFAHLWEPLARAAASEPRDGPAGLELVSK